MCQTISMPKKDDHRKTRKNTHWIPVVAGILRKGDLILVGRRPEGHSLGGLWEFPGGKIERGESPEKALIRELNEELGIEAEVGQLKLSHTHSYGDVNILILFFEVRFWKGEVQPKHHVELAWIKPKELLKRPIPEANLKIINTIFHVLGEACPES